MPIFWHVATSLIFAVSPVPGVFIALIDIYPYWLLEAVLIGKWETVVASENCILMSLFF